MADSDHNSNRAAIDVEIRALKARISELELAQRIHDQLERALYQSEARYAGLFDSTHDAVFLYSLEGKILKANDQAGELTGYSPEEMVGQDVRKFIVSRERESAEKVRAKLLAGERVPIYERTVQHRSGREIVVEINVALVHDSRGNPLHLQSIIRDITERKRSEARFRALFDHANDGITLYDLDGVILAANPRAAEMTGHAIEDMVGMRVENLISPEAYDDMMAVRKRLIDGEIVPIFDRVGRNVDGSPLWLEVGMSLVTDGEGHPQHIQSIARDVTERKQADLERERLITELDAFAHTVAHDIQGPLHILQGYADLLLTQGSILTADQYQESLEHIHHFALKLSDIVDDLLVLATVRQEADIAMERLDMPHLIGEAVSRLALPIEEYEATIEMSDQWPDAVGYGPWVEEVWVNLISNAIKYGGGPPRVMLSGEASDDGMVIFQVRDNGDGISEEDQTRLFEPFTRLRDRRAEGHGLGLSIVARIVERLGGEVGIESVRGEGSTFWFSLRENM